MDVVMLDLETMGCIPGAAIVQIGAVYFDKNGNYGAAIELNVDLQSSIKAGLSIDTSAIEFWLKQRHHPWLEDSMPLSEALIKLNIFIKGVSEIWCMPDFDLATIKIAMAKLDIEPAFNYNVGRDVRTIRDLFPVNEPSAEHGALADCFRQIDTVATVYKGLGLKV